MGVRMRMDGVYDYSKCLGSELTYDKMNEFVNRAYKMRGSVLRRMYGEQEENG